MFDHVIQRSEEAPVTEEVDAGIKMGQKSEIKERL